MPTILRSPRTANGTILQSSSGGAVAGPGVGVSGQPVNQLGFYNVVNTYNVGGLFSNALSYSVSSATAGFSIDGSGVVSYDGALADPTIASVVVTGYPEANQGGAGVALNAYQHRLDLPVAAVKDYAGRGWATDPDSSFKQDGGLDGAEGWTGELLALPAGFAATLQPGGLIEVTAIPSSPGSYTLPWRVFTDTGAIITGSKPVVITAPASTQDGAIDGTLAAVVGKFDGLQLTLTEGVLGGVLGPIEANFAGASYRVGTMQGLINPPSAVFSGENDTGFVLVPETVYEAST